MQIILKVTQENFQILSRGNLKLFKFVALKSKNNVVMLKNAVKKNVNLETLNRTKRRERELPSENQKKQVH